MSRQALHSRKPARVAAFTVLLATAVSMPAIAQAQSLEDDDDEMIIVTAQHREQVISEVPISISVVSGQEAVNAGASSTLDLARLVPGLSIGQNSGDGDFPFISLRGVTMRDFADTNESPSAVYINDFYKANLMGLDAQMFDLQRIEVLRGPQGTLYGRNATGGLIHFIAAPPTDELEGYVSATVGEYSRVKLEAAVGGPLAEGVNARLSAYKHSYSGYIKNNFPGAKDGNALDAMAVRGQLAFELTPDFKLDLFAQYYNNDNDAGNMFTHIAVTQDPDTALSVENPGGVDYLGYGTSAPGETNSNFDAYLKNEQLTLIGKATVEVGEVTVTSITGFEAGKKDAAFDSDSTPGPRATQVHPEAQEFTQELRVAGYSDALDWQIGAYYFDYHVYGDQQRQSSAAAGFRNPVFYDLKSESWAVFANADYELTPGLTATAGLRYTEEDKLYDLNNTDTGPVFNTTTVGDLATRNDNNVSFNGRLSWEPAEGQILYAGIARSFKAGTFNVGYTPINTDAISVRPERLTSYEAGAKYFAPSGLFSLSGAVFYYDYKDSQAFQFDGLTQSSTTFNRDAEVTGAELEFAARPFEGLRLRGSVTYLDATLLDVELPTFTSNPPVVDTRMPLAPKWSGNFGATYTLGMSDGSEFSLQGDVAYKSSQYFDAFNSPSQFEKSYALVNARIAWTDSSDRVTLAVFAENLFDKDYRTAAFDLAFLGLATEVWGKPQWFGGSVTYRFGS